MPFTIIRNDITRVKADAIVNTANPFPIYAGATDKSIYEAAGAEDLLAERRKIGYIEPGNVGLTNAYKLPAKYIIHAVGPVWNGGNEHEIELLESCIRKSLDLAEELDCSSIAFPLISTGAYEFPQDLALKIFTNTIYDFLMNSDMQIYLVLYNKEAFDLSTRIFGPLEDYLELKKEFRQHIGEKEMSFHDHLLKLMNDSGMTNPQIYHGANITKQHFSKILSNDKYTPSKNTICALALAMHLDEETARELLNKAGYALSDSIPFDKAIFYFLRNGMYNVIDNNIVLYDSGLEQLGTQTK